MHRTVANHSQLSFLFQPIRSRLKPPSCDPAFVYLPALVSCYIFSRAWYRLALIVFALRELLLNCKSGVDQAKVMVVLLYIAIGFKRIF